MVQKCNLKCGQQAGFQKCDSKMLLKMQLTSLIEIMIQNCDQIVSPQVHKFASLSKNTKVHKKLNSMN